MSATEKNFSNYQLGDNIYDLAGGLVPEVANRLDFDLTDQPSSENLFGLVGALGKNKVLRDNEEVTALDIPTAASLLERSGVQNKLQRSLWTPDQPLPYYVDAAVVTGAVANWQDRTARELIAAANEGKGAATVYLPTGNRVMNSGTELTNPNVQAFMDSHSDTPPTESQYAESVIVPRLTDVGLNVELIPYETKDGEAIAADFAATHTELWQPGKTVSAFRVANAGIQLAVQLRNAGRAVASGFDSNPEEPQLYVATDTFPIARTEEQVKDSPNFQSPYTGLRQAILTAKLLHEAAQD